MNRKKAGAPGPASDRLLYALPQIAINLQAGRRLTGIDPDLVSELGDVLLRVLCHEDARRLFRQAEMMTPQLRKARQIVLPVTVAYWYHYGRALHPEFEERAALELVRRAVGVKLAPATIRKYAQTHRDNVLAHLQEHGSFLGVPQSVAEWADMPEWFAPLKGAGAKNTKLRARVAAYRSYLRKKSEHMRDTDLE